MKISITAFGGTAPKIAPHQLPDSGAQVASNVRLTSGSLRALNTPAISTAPIVSAAKSIFSLGPSGGSFVMSWAADTDVARSPVADSEYRIYYTNGTAPKKTNLALASTGLGPYPAAEYNMGVATPTATMVAAASAGTAFAAGTWVYVYTFVTQFGSVLLEESAPSPAVTITTTAGANQAVALTGIASPAVTTGYNYVYKRIYRTQGTAFQLVAQIALATTSYTDNLSVTAILGDALPSADWLPPPADLQGLISMPSGTMAGFRNNEIWFSEPGFPHAWPGKYMQALDTNIVAIKAFGNNIAVATQTNPYIGSGVYPDSFTFTKIPRLEPCVSKRSMAGDEFGAMYASSNGLVSIGLDGDSVATATIMTRFEFANYAPSTMVGAVFEGRYYGFFTTGTYSGGIVFSKSESTGVRTIELGATAVTIEPMSAQLYYVNYIDNRLYSFDPISGVPMTFTWRSKRFNAPAPVNFAYVQVLTKEDSVADIAFQAAVDAANLVILANNAVVFAAGTLHNALADYTALNGFALNGSDMQTQIPAVSQTISLYVYAGSDIKFAKEVIPNRVYTLPSGFKSLGWDIAVIGQREVSSIEMANTMAEMKGS